MSAWVGSRAVTAVWVYPSVMLQTSPALSVAPADWMPGPLNPFLSNTPPQNQQEISARLLHLEL